MVAFGKWYRKMWQNTTWKTHAKKFIELATLGKCWSAGQIPERPKECLPKAVHCAEESMCCFWWYLSSSYLSWHLISSWSESSVIQVRWAIFTLWRTLMQAWCCVIYGSWRLAGMALHMKRSLRMNHGAQGVSPELRKLMRLLHATSWKLLTARELCREQQQSKKSWKFIIRVRWWLGTLHGWWFLPKNEKK